jgi:hypothetical protein
LAAQRLGLALAKLVGAREPAKVAGAGRILGNEEGSDLGLQLRRLLGLCQHGRRPQECCGNGGNDDRSGHL